jgi:tubulin polyglutamylase TTLL6/13
MYNISRKNTLGIHLKRFQKLFPEDFDFFPKTWLYPSDYHDIQEYFKSKQNKRKDDLDSGKLTEDKSLADPPVLLICKPDAGCQGRGIFIARKIEDMR